MKVYIQFDFEGVAGFVIRDNQDRNIPVVFERTRRLMKIATAEVSAAAEGAFAAGADQVVVWDSHGSGNTLLVEELSEKVLLITGDTDKGPWLPFFEGTDAGIYIGGHAMAGTPFATVPHTLMEVNGRAFGEVGMFVLECGSRNVPVVMVSGDSAVKDEVIDLIPKAEFVVTKIAAGPTLVKTITPALSCKMIFEAAKRGVGSRKNILPFKLPPPYKFKIPPKDGSSDSYFTHLGDDFLTAYRNYLKDYYGYSQGWPEWNLRKSDKEINCL
ncbi:MAG: M55 family metallopeptidase [Verrucomicrobia bacterium]|nr:M55 family metallopeptidase [Verrucomicrobiota bacterium]MBU1734197.1 M55 family metallopeptidase [Verrucomicrobiota bacterium]MBU1856533.1 M55 family metallopeptidase [Verrucomicrobiota bacterium]